MSPPPVLTCTCVLVQVSDTLPQFPTKISQKLGEGWAGAENQEAAQNWTASVARCGFLTYLRRDATALGLLLLSIGDITSSFLKDGCELSVPLNDGGSMSHFKLDVNRRKTALTKM
ncbi:MAG: hypothetical protein Kow0070_13860 [Anaerolineales bacterium]